MTNEAIIGAIIVGIIWIFLGIVMPVMEYTHSKMYKGYNDERMKVEQQAAILQVAITLVLPIILFLV